MSVQFTQSTSQRPPLQFPVFDDDEKSEISSEEVGLKRKVREVAVVGSDRSNWKLPEKLIALSVKDTWAQAVKEWELTDIEMIPGDEDAHTCLCSHYPIREVCHIWNVKNRQSAEVGNCCIQRIQAEESEDLGGTHKIFDAVKRIRTDTGSSANLELIQHARKTGIFDAWEEGFYTDIWRKRALTDGQETIKRRLNGNLLLGLVWSVKQAFKRVEANIKLSAGPKLIKYAFEKGAIRDRDRDFYIQTWKKSYESLSEKQQSYRRALNQKICAAFKLTFP